MNIKFNKRKIETSCILISFVLVVVLTISAIFAIADGLFSWDILPENIEKIAILFMSASGLIIVATFLISLMVNLSLISLNVEKIANKINKQEQEADEK
nr:hypothetical protein [Bacteroidota bacterium]